MNKYLKFLIFAGVIAAIVLIFSNKTKENLDNYHIMPDGSVMINDPHLHNAQVKSDEDFLLGMIPHHEEAVQTAKEVLARGGSFPEIIILAENIISSQTGEIEKMKAWHEEWLEKPYQDSRSYMPMMRDLSLLSGAELDKVFLEDMVLHHIGAISMVESLLEFTERESLKELGSAIIKAQSHEIEIMQAWLKTKF